MDPLLNKLNFKAHRRVWLLGAPDGALGLRASLQAHAEVCSDPNDTGPFDFAVLFLRRGAEVAQAAAAVGSLAEDAPFWCCYPKKGSRMHAPDLSRDHGWQPLGAVGFEPVRLVALDEDWSALRFRKAERIKVMARAPEAALSPTGQAKARGTRRG